MLFRTKDLHFGFEGNTVLEKLNITFEDGDRVGFIGQNGVGKTTFLRLLLGELLPESGEIIKRNNLKIGYLKQNAGLTGDKTVYETMLDAFSDVFETEKRMREIELELANHEVDSFAYNVLATEHRNLDHYHTARNGYLVETRVNTVIEGMGFSGARDKMISVLSGGERTRLALAKLLLIDADLLVLDEPTNHLDVNTMAWLEKFLLEEYKGCLLIVSHDRYFLDKIVKKIWDLEEREITEYRGNYTKYKQLKAENLYSLERAYAKQQEQVSAMLEYAERNIARATTSKSAKSRLHRLANMELIEKPKTFSKQPVFIFKQKNEANKNVLSVKELCLKVADLTLVDSVSFEVTMGEKLAIVGANGIGKSTLIKTLLGLENAVTDHYNPVPELQSSAEFAGFSRSRHCNGAITYGKNLRISYYDQENVNLTGSNTVLEELWYRFPLLDQTTARSIIAKMLFTADDMDKLVSSLSGGERAKLAFAIVMAEESNLLFFDEPTNHLDLQTREALENGINEFEGTVVYVSHDRYFMNATATSLLELSESGVKIFKGSFDNYQTQKERQQNAERQQKEEEKNRKKAEEKPLPKVQQKSFRTKEDRRLEAKRVERIRELEKLITEKEELIEKLNDALYNGKEYAKMNEIYAEIERENALLEELYQEWEALSE